MPKYLIHFRLALFNFLCLIWLIGISPNAKADSELLIMGGSGDSEETLKRLSKTTGEGTIFDESLKGIGKATQRSSWRDIDVRFDGGHVQTTSIRNSYFQGGSKGDFTPDSYKEMITKYEDRMKNGPLKKGDQLLIIVDSHGAMNEKYLTESGVGKKAHYVSSGNTVVDLGDLENLTKLAKEKGIKLAILDFSCHSGASLDLANENTCVISASSPNHVSWTTYADAFLKNMQAGGSLEDIFLKTKESATNTEGSNFSMISSPVGLKLNEIFYKRLNPYMLEYSVDPAFGSYYNKNLKNYIYNRITDPNQECTTKEQFDLLTTEVKNLQEDLEKITDEEYRKKIKSIEDLPWWKKNLVEVITGKQEERDKLSALNIKKMREKEFKDFWSALDEYRDLYSKNLNSLKENLPVKLEVDLNKTYDFNMGNAKTSYSGRDLIATDFYNLKNNLTSTGPCVMAAKKNKPKNCPKTNLTIKQYQETLKFYDSVLVKQKELISSSQEMANWKNKALEKIGEEIKDYSRSSALAKTIGEQVQRLYAKKYEQLKSNFSDQKNPCEDFKL